MDISDLGKITEHPSYLLGDKIAEICAPLFSNFPINYFCYTKWRKNAGAILSSDKNWLRYYVQSDYNFLINGKKIHSWSSNMSPKALHEASSKFNYHNGIIVEKTYLECVETLEVASPNKYADPLEFCCNKDLLNQFFLYFKDKANKFIEVIENDPIYFPKNRFLKMVGEVQCQSYDSYYSQFYKSINHKKIRFKFKTKEIFFSRREFETLCLLAKGKSMVEAAEILQISPRTVETYLYDAKSKTDMFTVGQLLDNFTDSLF